MDEQDVIIIGAGLSGIGAARHLMQKAPGQRFLILEGREAIGGTWDLFRYPGIRSDSDMFTLGYDFRPWREQKAIADGPSILRYIKETAAEAGLETKIRFRHHVRSADFNSATGRWTVVADTPDGEVRLSARFLLMAAGYYSYTHPHNPAFPGEAGFQGRIFHAQHWPEDLDVEGKRILVIGSGATAVTIVPVLARTAAAVTMIQRSPTWMVARPSQDWFANLVRALLPEMAAYRLIRWRNTLLQHLVFRGARANPAKARERLTRMLLKELPADLVKAHFQPRYNVWEQRLCLVPDGDFFAALRAGRAEVATDEIAEILPDGVRLASGRKLGADIIVKATGLSVQMLGGATLSVDGVPMPAAQRTVYRGMMLSDIPNMIYVFGYFNASWTLRADLTCDFACRLLNEMEARGRPIVVPVLPAGQTLEDEPLLLSSGYVLRARAQMPRQASIDPWRDTQNYLADRKRLRHLPIDDGVLQFRPLADAPALLAEAAE